ncbi:histidine phosphatase family protein [Mucilaginibacter limnophilus]|uniref:Histidine phosphatase family protein n=1 Tax=Mucilaginibacter limnophilus TaxID=1932778 RepID=A0A3S2UM27_9SPHI|nr:histidine phosphatase family protein [Mucilaginibacter limnophilus]RVT98082.1 histidine phosphatase family protein [Mucilaginibacter limnophilus]
MKRLLLIRHAKATHESGYIDFERPLTPEGVEDASYMAERVKEQNIVPDILISSPALRTLATANIFSQHLAGRKPETNKDIYDASEQTLLKVINNFPDNVDYIGLVGHNPGISQILYYLTGKVQEMDTSGIALIEFKVDSWTEVSGETGTLISYDSPKSA